MVLKAPYFAKSDFFREQLYNMSGVNPRRILHERSKCAKKCAAAANGNKSPSKSKGYSDAVVEIPAQALDMELEGNHSPSLEEPEGANVGEQGSALLNEESANTQTRRVMDKNETIHHVILDFSAANYIDLTGVKVLKQVLQCYPCG